MKADSPYRSIADLRGKTLGYTDFNSPPGYLFPRSVMRDQGVAPDTFFGARKAATKLHPITRSDPTNCTEQLGAPGPWYDRLPHFQIGSVPASPAPPSDRRGGAIRGMVSAPAPITPW